MLFSSLVFLYGFLPLLFVCYYLAKEQYRNYILLLFSLFFYAWGEPKYILLLITTVVGDYLLGLALYHAKYKQEALTKAKLILAGGVGFNLLILGYFKYSYFIGSNINRVLSTDFTLKAVILPIGISFFIFQALSYIIDVYRGDGRVQKSLPNLMLYISLFPQLIAGPIVRYSTIDHQLTERKESVELFASGITRFILGLGKKVLLANNMAVVADRAFNAVAKGDEVSTLFAWIGVACYALQIYFDFSGYSDMAIGLGRMFGFQFLENFNYPYISKSISEFWRRWHISLGSWFRDYVYIPLGGNRRGVIRNIFNLGVVWFLTGLWHGASWNFIFWGCYFGGLIMVEKYLLEGVLAKVPRVVKLSGTLMLVLLGWVLFRASRFKVALSYYAIMFGRTENLIDPNVDFFIYEYGLFFLIALIGATPLPAYICGKWLPKKVSPMVFQVVEILMLLVILYVCTAYLVASNFNPFIYFNF